MKIILVHNTYQQPGGEDVVFEQERRLLEQMGHTVVTYCRSNHEIEELSTIGRTALVMRTVWAGDTHRDFGALLVRENPDIVHVHNTFIMVSPSIYSACRKHCVPVVQTLHNFRLLCPGAQFLRDGKICEDCVDHSLWRGVWHGCYRDSRPATASVALMLAWHRRSGTWDELIDRYIALTEFSRNKFIASGISKDKILVKPNFVDPDPGAKQGPGEYAIFVGRVSREKGLHTLLDAWERSRKIVPSRLSAMVLSARNSSGSGTPRPLFNSISRPPLARRNARGNKEFISSGDAKPMVRGFPDDRSPNPSRVERQLYVQNWARWKKS